MNVDTLLLAKGFLLPAVRPTVPTPNSLLVPAPPLPPSPLELPSPLPAVRRLFVAPETDPSFVDNVEPLAASDVEVDVEEVMEDKEARAEVVATPEVVAPPDMVDEE